jgi:TonB family protein
VTILRLFAAASIMAGGLCHDLVAAEWVVRRLVSLEYPNLAILSREQATISIRCDLSPEGIVTNAYIERSNSDRPGSVLEKAALENARSWEFKYVGESRSAPKHVRLTYTFRLAGTCDSGCCSSQFSYGENAVLVTAKYRRVNH